MNSYEALLDECKSNNIQVIEKKFKSNACGLWKDNKIGISTKLTTIPEKNSILAEELGHYYTSYGNIVNLNDLRNVKQEKRARNWAYRKLVPLHKLIDVFNLRLKTRFEIADYMGVTEEFLDDAIKYYRQKYGTHFEIDDYIIYFEPTFGVLKVF